jgi:hypothetical protein
MGWRNFLQGLLLNAFILKFSVRPSLNIINCNKVRKLTFIELVLNLNLLCLAFVLCKVSAVDIE